MCFEGVDSRQQNMNILYFPAIPCYINTFTLAIINKYLKCLTEIDYRYILEKLCKAYKIIIFNFDGYYK